MAARSDHVPWHDVELADLRRLSEVEGRTAEQSARFLNEKYHKGQPVRSESACALKRTKRKWKVAKVPKVFQDQGPRKEQEIEREETLDSITLTSRGSRIKTVAELLAHANVTGEVTKQTVKTWDTTLVEGGESKTVQNFAIHVEVKPNQTSTEDAVQAIIDGAFATRRLLPKAKLAKVPQSGLMQALFIMDPHIGKKSWPGETRRGPYDTAIGVQTLREANADLIRQGNERKVAERVILLGGDFFNADTKAGTTTGGTPLDNDSRIQKMLEEGAKAMFDIVEWSAEFCPTKVMLVPGNHDSSKTWALQLILQAYFRHDKRVTVDGGYASRKYLTHGKCLIGLTHGDKGWKRLPGLMSREAAYEWGQTTLRHIHHGHLHSKRQVDTVDGVTVFQHPALCEADAYHAEEGFVSDRGQETYYYHSAGVLAGMDFYSPDVDAPVMRGVR